jgi:cobalt transporter subunit CbtA
MALFQRLFFAVLCAGLLSGALMASLQQWQVVPLILAAEVYEGAGPAAAHDHAAETTAAHEHGEDEWAPADGFERSAYTVAATILASIGFAFALSAASLLTGFAVTARNGVLWGLAGFLVFQLAPALGLPPELPGMPAAEVVPRQIWWLGTALATATALYGIARFSNWGAIVIGAVLVLLPHLIGAPQPPHEPSGVPAHLATQFAAATLFTGCVSWLALGAAYGYFMDRMGAAAPAAAGAKA